MKSAIKNFKIYTLVHKDWNDSIYIVQAIALNVKWFSCIYKWLHAALYGSQSYKSFQCMHTHILLVLWPFFTLLVGHNDTNTQRFKHRVSAVRLCCQSNIISHYTEKTSVRKEVFRVQNAGLKKRVIICYSYILTLMTMFTFGLVNL